MSLTYDPGNRVWTEVFRQEEQDVSVQVNAGHAVR